MKSYYVLFLVAVLIAPLITFAAIEVGTNSNSNKAVGAPAPVYRQSGYSSSNIGSMPSFSDVKNFSNSYRQGTYYGQSGYSSGSSGSGSKTNSPSPTMSGSTSKTGGSDSSSSRNWFQTNFDAAYRNAVAVAKAIVTSPQAAIEYGGSVVKKAQERLNLLPATTPSYTNLPPSSPTRSVAAAPSSVTANSASQSQILNKDIPDFVYEQFAHDEALRRAAAGDTSRDGLTAAEREALDRACLSGLECNSPAVREAVRISLEANNNNARKSVETLVTIGIETGVHPDIIAKRKALGLNHNSSGDSCNKMCEAYKRFDEIGITQGRILTGMEASDERQLAIRKEQGLQPLTITCLDGGTQCHDKPGVVRIAGGDEATVEEAIAAAERSRIFGAGAVSEYSTDELYDIYNGKTAASITGDEAFNEIRRRTGLNEWLQTFSDDYLKKVVQNEAVDFQFMELNQAVSELDRRGISVPTDSTADEATKPQVVVTLPNEGSFSFFDTTPFTQQVPAIQTATPNAQNVNLLNPTPLAYNAKTIRTASVDMSALPQIGYRTFEGIQETTIPARSVKTLSIYDTGKINYNQALGAYVPASSSDTPVTGNIGTNSFVRGSEDLKVILPVGQKPYAKEHGIPVMSPGELLLIGKLDLTQGGKYNAAQEKAALDLALRGELDSDTLNAIDAGAATPAEYSEAASIVITLYNRAIAEGTSLHYQIIGKRGAVTSVTVDKRAYDIKAPGLPAQIDKMISGALSQEIGLSNFVPDEVAYATHYYSPEGILAYNQRDDDPTNDNVSTPAKWDIDKNLPFYPSDDGHIFGNVLFDDKSGTEYPVAGILLPVKPVSPDSTILPDRAILIAQAQRNNLPVPNTGSIQVANTPAQVPKVTIPGIPDNPNPQVASNLPLSGETVQQVFDNAAIEVVESKPGATQLEGMRAGTVAEVLDLERQLPGQIVITGGTEKDYHDETITYSHIGGYKVDIRLNDATRSYVESLTPAGTRGDGAKLYTDPTKPNVTYAIESNHIDITVKSESTDILTEQQSNTIVGGYKDAHPDRVSPTQTNDTPQPATDESADSWFSKVTGIFTSGAKGVAQFVGNIMGTSGSTSKTGDTLPERNPDVRALTIGDIKEIKVYFGLDILCPQIQGVSDNPYLYTVSFYSKETVVKRTGCGEGSVDTFANAIAQDLQKTQGFGPLDPNRLRDKMDIVFYGISASSE